MYYDNRTRDFVVDFWNDINHIHTTTLYFLLTIVWSPGSSQELLIQSHCIGCVPEL